MRRRLLLSCARRSGRTQRHEQGGFLRTARGAWPGEGRERVGQRAAGKGRKTGRGGNDLVSMDTRTASASPADRRKRPAGGAGPCAPATARAASFRLRRRGEGRAAEDGPFIMNGRGGFRRAFPSSIRQFSSGMGFFLLRNEKTLFFFPGEVDFMRCCSYHATTRTLPRAKSVLSRFRCGARQFCPGERRRAFGAEALRDTDIVCIAVSAYPEPTFREAGVVSACSASFPPFSRAMQCRRRNLEDRCSPV